MKYIILALVIVILLSTPINAQIPHDKQLHFLAGAVIYSASVYLDFDNPLLFVTLVGISKELHDATSNKHTFDIMDIVATTAGGVVLWSISF